MGEFSSRSFGSGIHARSGAEPYRTHRLNAVGLAASA